MTEEYTYEQYLALYEACSGTTTHFYPGIGVTNFPKNKLSREDFERRLGRQREIETHDDAYWMMRNNIDEMESEDWESLHIRSDLFIIELEKVTKYKDALNTRREK